MAELIWSERAIEDLNSIGEYIALDSEYAAKKFIEELIKKANILSIHPGKGRPIPENIPGNYRQIYIKVIGLFIESKRKPLLFPPCITRKNYYLKLIINDIRQNHCPSNKRRDRI